MLTLSNEEITEILEIAMDKDLDDFSMEANWYFDMEMDSLAAVALVVEIQKRYGIRIPDERMPEVQTGEQLRAIIEELSVAPAVPPAAEVSDSKQASAE